MNTGRYALAAGAFVLLMAGGIGAGVLLNGDGPRPDPATAPSPPLQQPGVVRLLALGDVGKDSATQRQVRDAATRVCEARGCDLAVLLGDNLYPRGMERSDDPRMDEVIGDMYGSWPWPVYLVLGNHDVGHTLDRRKAAWQVAWARRTDGFELPAPTWTAQAGPVGLWGLDTNELFWADATAQTAWLDQTVRASVAKWRVALGHHPFRSEGPHGNAGSYDGAAGVPYAAGAGIEAFYRDHVCGRFDVVLTGHDHSLQWIEDCGTAWVVSGSGGSTTELPGHGNQPLYAADVAGGAWLSFEGDQVTIAFFDATGAVTFEAVRHRDDRITTPDGALLALPSR